MTIFCERPRQIVAERHDNAASGLVSFVLNRTWLPAPSIKAESSWLYGFDLTATVVADGAEAARPLSSGLVKELPSGRTGRPKYQRFESSFGSLRVRLVLV